MLPVALTNQIVLFQHSIGSVVGYKMFMASARRFIFTRKEDNNVSFDRF